MSLFFQNAGWMWLLALGLLPLLVHLFARVRPPVFPFSSVEFLRRAVRKTSRWKKPQDVLILALRTVAILAAAAAILGPLLVSSEAPLPGAMRTVVLLIDRSASMSAGDGPATRFETACREAAEFLERSKPDLANVVWIDAQPDAVFPSPGPNADFLVQSVDRAEAGVEPGSIAAAWQLALRQVEAGAGHRELVVFSDFQESAWRGQTLAAPPSVSVKRVRVAESEPANAAVVSLTVLPSEPVAGQEVSILCRVKNFSGTPIRPAIYLDPGGGRQSRQVEVAPWGEAEAVFPASFSEPGAVAITAGIDSDGFPGDDVRSAIVHVRRELSLALVGADDSTAAVFAAIARALPWLRVEPLETLRANAGHDFWFVGRWSGENAGALRAIAASGGAVFAEGARGLTGKAISELLGAGGAGGAGETGATSPVAEQSDAAGWAARVASPAAPVFALFQSGDFGNPFDGRFRRRLALEALEDSATPASGEAEVLVRYEDGVPGLVRGETGGAPVYLWNLPVRPEDSDWAQQTPFLPFVAELLLNSRPPGVGAGQEAPAGSPLVWQSGDDIPADSVLLVDADGKSVPIEWAHGPEGLTFRSKASPAPGVFRWTVGGGTSDLAAINFPASESDLRVLDTSAMPAEETLSLREMSNTARLARGWQLWPWLAAGAIGALLIEGLLAWWKPKPRPERAWS